MYSKFVLTVPHLYSPLHFCLLVKITDGEEHNKVSRVNLVDLAGSERSDAAGTSGVRLRVRTPFFLFIFPYCSLLQSHSNIHTLIMDYRHV